jgi:5'-nucleotidase
MRFIRPLVLLGPLAMLAACATVPRSASAPVMAPVEVGIVAINDFHGNLEPPHQSVLAPDGQGGSVAVPAGGAAYLASAIESVRAKYPNHLTVSAGDMIGASPIASSLFLDEPAIEVMNRIGIDFNAVGNHEFDRGPDELKRMAHGGCAKWTERTPCALEPFRGAQFPFLAANTHTADGRTLFPGTALRSFGSGAGKVTVGLIGVTLKGTGDLSTAESRAKLTWADEADTVNAAVPGLKAAGADAVVLLIHQGGRTKIDAPAKPDPNGCDGLYGDILPILDRLDPRVDLVVSAHTHWAYICEYRAPGRDTPVLLTSGGLFGEMVTDIRLLIDPATHHVVARSARNVIVQSAGYTGAGGFKSPTPLYPAFAPRADIAAYVARYAAAAASVADRPVGHLSGPAPKSEGAEGGRGGPLGKLIADSQLAATRANGAQIAFMNPFGIRTSLIPAADGTVTFGQAYAVEPFNNHLVTRSFTGAQLKALLEQCFDGIGPEQVLTPSVGFSFAYDRSRAVGDRIVRMTLNGRPVDPAATYRITVSEFLANGGDSFSVFTQGRDEARGPVDLDALITWLERAHMRTHTLPVPQDAREIDLAPALSRPDPNRVSPPGVHY